MKRRIIHFFIMIGIGTLIMIAGMTDLLAQTGPPPSGKVPPKVRGPMMWPPVYLPVSHVEQSSDGKYLYIIRGDTIFQYKLPDMNLVKSVKLPEPEVPNPAAPVSETDNKKDSATDNKKEKE